MTTSFGKFLFGYHDNFCNFARRKNDCLIFYITHNNKNNFVDVIGPLHLYYIVARQHRYIIQYIQHTFLKFNHDFNYNYF